MAQKYQPVLIHPDFEEPAERYSTMVRIQLEHGNFERAKVVIDEAEKELQRIIANDRIKTLEQLLDLPLAMTDIPLRTINYLEESLGVTTIGELLEKDTREIFAVHGIGESAVDEMVNALRRLGLPNNSPPVDARVDSYGRTLEAHQTFTQYFGAAAIFSIVPCTEEAARAAADRFREYPIELVTTRPAARITDRSQPLFDDEDQSDSEYDIDDGAF